MYLITFSTRKTVIYKMFILIFFFFLNVHEKLYPKCWNLYLIPTFIEKPQPLDSITRHIDILMLIFETWICQLSSVRKSVLCYAPGAESIAKFHTSECIHDKSKMSRSLFYLFQKQEQFPLYERAIGSF